MKKFKKITTLVIAATMLLSTNIFAATDVQSLNGQSKSVNVMPRGSWTVEWKVSGNSNEYGTSSFNLNSSSKFTYDITWSPKPGTMRVGFYNRDTGKYDWKQSDSKSLKGTMQPSGTGLYSFALGNTSDTAVTFTGSFSH